MGYLDPSAYKVRVILAHGPGVHADEADSALPDLEEFLSASATRHLEAVAGPSPVRHSSRRSTARRNPPGDAAEEEDDDEDGEEDESTTIVPQAMLFPLAMLTTGQWGPTKGEQDAEVFGPRGNPRRRLPMASGARANPVEDVERLPFFARMQYLGVLLDELYGYADERYEHKGPIQAREDAAARARGEKVPTRKVAKDDEDLGPYPWLAAIKLMREAVGFVQAQEYVAPSKRSILDKGDPKHPKPLGQEWGVIADKGNKKLNFVAYSELPMASCAGAGECGVSYDYFEEHGITRDASGKRIKKPARAMKVVRDAQNHVVYKTDKAGNRIQRVSERTGRPMFDQEGRPEWQPKMAKEKVAKKTRKGWCYSFKAFRYPGAFARLFRNTIAAYADREFAILAHGGSEKIVGTLKDRVESAVAGRAMREWPQYVKLLVLASTESKRAENEIRFLRLFVDGDINTEDNIIEWMDVCRQIGVGGKSIIKGRQHTGSDGKKFTRDDAHVEVYGYSKCWRQFTNVDAYYRSKNTAWPTNYVVNLSSGSIYVAGKYVQIRGQMEKLPISRGYFEAVPIRAYLPLLRKQAEAFRNPKEPVPVRDITPWPFEEKRIRRFLEVYSVRSLTDLHKAVPGLAVPKTLQELDERLRKVGGRAMDDKKRKELGGQLEEGLRKLAYTALLEEQMANPAFQKVLLAELAKDRSPNAEGDELAAMEAKQAEQLKRMFNKEALLKGDKYTGSKGFYDKALALALHEVIWSFDLGGACPLVCSNCADTTGDTAVHRCAAKPGSPLWHRTIHIGLH